MFGTKTNSAAGMPKWIGWMVVTTLALTLVPMTYAKKDKKKKETAVTEKKEAPKVDTSKLVWPQPPDIARVRFLEEMKGENKAQEVLHPKKKKQGWMDRLAGVEQGGGPRGEINHVLAKPYGVGVDSKGRIYVADTYVAAVFIYDQEKKSIELIRNGIEAKFKTIIGLAIDDNDRVFVSDASLKNVSVFGADRKLETTFGDDEFGRPTGMAIDVENRLLYVVDSQKETVFVFDADTLKKLRTIGHPAAKEGDEDPGTLSRPTNVTVDQDGNVYITDTINDRIQIFDPDGTFISMFGKNGDGPGTFARPKGVAIDADGHIWVADASQCRIQVFDREGHLLAYFGEPGFLPGQFGLPAGLFIDKNNRVIVSEQLKGRIQIFRYFTDAEVAAAKAEREKRAGNAGATKQAEVKQ
jgi:sugar lactone lactonase YvrE